MKNKLTARELSNFCGQMGILLHSGISTTEGLHILCEESKTDTDCEILKPLINSMEKNASLPFGSFNSLALFEVQLPIP